RTCYSATPRIPTSAARGGPSRRPGGSAVPVGLLERCELLVGHAVELCPHVEPRGELPRIALGVPAVVGEDGAAPLVDDRDGADFVRLLLVEVLTLEVDDSFTHAAGSSRPRLPRNPLGLGQRGRED